MHYIHECTAMTNVMLQMILREIGPGSTRAGVSTGRVSDGGIADEAFRKLTV